MANAPKDARQKRSTPPRQENDQREPEGSAHRPEDFDVQNPAKQVPDEAAARAKLP